MVSLGLATSEPATCCIWSIIFYLAEHTAEESWSLCPSAIIKRANKHVKNSTTRNWHSLIGFHLIVFASKDSICKMYSGLQLGEGRSAWLSYRRACTTQYYQKGCSFSIPNIHIPAWCVLFLGVLTSNNHELQLHQNLRASRVMYRVSFLQTYG